MNPLAGGACRFGLGTALGPEDDDTDERLRQIVSLALSLGVRVFDTAINYRSGRSERVLGQVVGDAVATGALERSEVVLMTKGGYRRPRPVGGEASQQPEHSLDPAFIRAQIDESSAGLGVGIDVYFLHNPEEQAMVLSHREYISLLARTIELLEAEVGQGRIGSYGIASWRLQGSFAPFPAVDVAELCRLATAVGGEAHRLTAVQAPLSLFDRDVLRPHQQVGDRMLSLPEACSELDLALVASATAGRGRSPGLAAASSRWAASVPGVSTALVGTLNPDHLRETVGSGVAAVVD